MQHASRPIMEFKADLSTRICEGYASTWSVDLGNDRFERGAFLATIKENFTDRLVTRGNSGIKVMRQHGEIIGVLLAIKEDAVGLWVRFKISKTPLGDETLALLIDGALDAMSVGYAATKSHDEEGVRVITVASLFEVSVVDFAMQPETSAAVVKEFNGGKQIQLKALPVRFVEGKISEVTNMPEQEEKRGATISQATATGLMHSLTTIAEILKTGGYDVSIVNHGHVSGNVSSTGADPEMDAIARQTDAERAGSQSHVNPGTQARPGVLPDGTYSPNSMLNPNGAVIKSVTGVQATYSCAKCGTELKCEGCGNSSGDYKTVKDVNGVRTAFKCASCGKAMFCSKCDDGGMDTMAAHNPTEEKNNLQESKKEKKDSEGELVKKRLNELKMFLDGKETTSAGQED